MLEAVLFDVDGTLLKSMERQYNWFDEWARRHDKVLPFSAFHDFLAFYNEAIARGGAQRVYDELELPCDMNDESHPVWSAYNKYLNENGVEMYTGVKEMIVELWKIGRLPQDGKRNRRLSLGINTTNSWKGIYNDLARGGVVEYFDIFVTKEVLAVFQGVGKSDGLTKPSSVSVALSLNLLNSEGSRVIHVGDTRNDLRASLNVVRGFIDRPESLITVGACYGYEGRELLEKGVVMPDKSVAHFTHLIESPYELVGIVKEYLCQKKP